MDGRDGSWDGEVTEMKLVAGLFAIAMFAVGTCVTVGKAARGVSRLGRSVAGRLIENTQ